MSYTALLTQALARVDQQVEWIDHCGGSLSGYMARYGDTNGPEGLRYGQGGQAIYEADIAELGRRWALARKALLLTLTPEEVKHSASHGDPPFELYGLR